MRLCCLQFWTGKEIIACYDPSTNDRGSSAVKQSLPPVLPRLVQPSLPPHLLPTRTIRVVDAHQGRNHNDRYQHRANAVAEAPTVDLAHGSASSLQLALARLPACPFACVGGPLLASLCGGGMVVWSGIEWANLGIVVRTITTGGGRVSVVVVVLYTKGRPRREDEGSLHLFLASPPLACTPTSPPVLRRHMDGRQYTTERAASCLSECPCMQPAGEASDAEGNQTQSEAGKHVEGPLSCTSTWRSSKIRNNVLQLGAMEEEEKQRPFVYNTCVCGVVCVLSRCLTFFLSCFFSHLLLLASQHHT